MSDAELARFFLSLVLLLVGALGGGQIFERLRMPRVIGEIAGGVILGPSVLGLISPAAEIWLFSGFPAHPALLSAFYWFGLVLLMFTAGLRMPAEGALGAHRLVAALVLGALGLPFLAGYAAAPLFSEARLGNPLAFSLVMGIAVAVTSIPVASRIFLDLGPCAGSSMRSPGSGSMTRGAPNTRGSPANSSTSSGTPPGGTAAGSSIVHRRGVGRSSTPVVTPSGPSR